MSAHRSHFRNVQFYDAKKPSGPALGGFLQNGSVSEANFLQMLEIVLVLASPVCVRHRASGHVVSGIDSRLEVGAYDVSCTDDSPIELSDELWVYRIASINESGQENAFREGIRARDGRCVVSGAINQGAPYWWTSFEAAHVFPLESENLWNQWGHGRWVTDMDDNMEVSKLHSCQNGVLLRPQFHCLFNQYLLSVNPDDKYKIVVFDHDYDGVDGRILDPICRDPADPHRVSDNLLRWHYRQSVLANVRGEGAPVLECDFPPGTDMVGEILRGPYAKERLELEIAARLRGLV